MSSITEALASIGIAANPRAVSLMCKWFTRNRTELPDTPWRTYDVYRVFARIAEHAA